MAVRDTAEQATTATSAAKDILFRIMAAGFRRPMRLMSGDTQEYPARQAMSPLGGDHALQTGAIPRSYRLKSHIRE
jgi:hypothetical protein